MPIAHRRSMPLTPSSFRFGAKRIRRIWAGLAGVPAALALLAATSLQPAKAENMFYNIVEAADGLIQVYADGQLDLDGAQLLGVDSCGDAGAIVSSSAVICTGPDEFVTTYSLSGPSSFAGSVNMEAIAVAGIPIGISGALGYFLIDGSYQSGTNLYSTATFNGPLQAAGFTTTGLLGTWTIDGTGSLIQVVVTPYTPPEPVPGPLPMLGVAAAFGYSRRLRRRITASQATPSQDGTR